MPKGQIISLDFLISLILIFLILSLLSNSLEINYYNLKQIQSQEKLKLIAFNASHKLLDNNITSCKVYDELGNDLNYFFDNCLNGVRLNDVKLSYTELKSIIGVPKDFFYNISIYSSNNILITSYGDDLSCIEDIASIDRNILFIDAGTGDIKKKGLEGCINGLIDCSKFNKKLVISVGVK